MENASKALLMAAGVLIGLLIMSLAVYLFLSFATTSAQLHEENYQKQVDQFNSQFTSYVGNDNITIYDVVSIANLATETNIYYELKKEGRSLTPSANEVKDNYISVKLINPSINSRYTGNIEKGYGTDSKEITNYYNQLIKEELDKVSMDNPELTKYKCEANISPNTRKSFPSNFYKKIVEIFRIKIYNKKG